MRAVRYRRYGALHGLALAQVPVPCMGTQQVLVILEAKRGFRKLRGHMGMPILVAALNELLRQPNVDDQEAAA